MMTQSLTLAPDKHVTLTLEHYGGGVPVLLLHGGAGPASVTAFAQRLAAAKPFQVYVPTHPGFMGTPRPAWLSSVAALAEVYGALLEKFALEGVTLVGNSIGGWIAAEMALHHSKRIGGVVLVNAVGIEVEAHPVADIFSLSLDEITQRSYFNPVAFRRDPATLTEDERGRMAANRATLAVYSGSFAMADPTLLPRLQAVTVPTLVVWGQHDQIVTPEYGRAYAAGIPTARFELLEQAGHLPQLETPDALIHTIVAFVAYI